MKKSIILGITFCASILVLSTSCSKKNECVCTIDNVEYVYDVSGQNAVTAKQTCDAMKMSTGMTGTGSCKLR